MSQDWVAHAIVIAVTLVVVAATVLIHYEGLTVLGRHYARQRGRPGRHVVLMVIFGLLLLHVTEIWLFGAAYWGLLMLPDTGSIAGPHSVGLLNSVYLSAVTYTTVGFGDLVPVGPIRFLSGTEALTGLLLITWSASFTYLEMSRFWRDEER